MSRALESKLPRASRAAFVLTVALAACVGEIGDRPEGALGGDPSDVPHGPSGSTVLRRLNRVELTNTFADLLGSAYGGAPDAVAQRLPGDPRVQGFDTIADALTTSTGFVEQAHGLVEAMVTDTDIDALHGCATPGAACVEGFLDDVGLRALRRPLSGEERASYLALFDKVSGTDGSDVAMRAVLTRLLQTPDFLYHVALGDPDTGRLDAFELASRLSYVLWESMPDAELFTAAAGGSLETAEEVEAQIARMLDDPRAKKTIQRFFGLWFRVDALDDTVKDPEVYPGFDELRASMRGEFERYVEHVVFENEGDLEMLLTSRETFVDATLAELYGVTPPAGGGFEKVELDPSRAGILSQGAFLSIAGKANRSAPILRGIFVRERLLCAPLPPPPPNASAIPPDLPSPTTTRDFFTDLTSPELCNSCHSVINPIGFAFEHFDGIGRYRDAENGYPIDATGALTAGDQAGPVDGAVELAARLAASEDVQRCLATQWFRFRFGRLGGEADAPIVDQLAADFVASGGNLRALAASLARSPALYQAHFELPLEPEAP